MSIDKAKRSAFFQLALGPALEPDLATLLGVHAEQVGSPWVAWSALRTVAIQLSVELVTALRTIPAHSWTSLATLLSSGLSLQTIEHLAEIGLVIVDPATGVQRDYAAREAQLQESAWHPQAAIYHFCSKWHDVALNFAMPEDSAEAQQRMEAKSALFLSFIEQHGSPPPHFHTRQNSIGQQPLAPVVMDGELAALLSRRRTRRVFDSQQEIPFGVLSSLIGKVFGVEGIYQVHGNIYGLGKTSPSGGGLHPTEIYVLANRVESVQPGLYHYNQQRHQLHALRYLTSDEASALADQFTAGQKYPEGAAMLCLLTSRFYRNYWKYRGHPRAYPVLYMDIAHLSQTFYLACEKLGLGAFFTAAINAGAIEKALQLNEYEEGAMAVLGCGIPALDQLGMTAIFSRYRAENENSEGGGP